MTPDEIEARLVFAMDTIRRKVRAKNSKVHEHNLAIFFEDNAGGYAGIEASFDEVVKIATRLWGTPSKGGFGRSHSRADVAGVPDWLLDSRALRYVFWSNPDFLATISMTTHDADSVRNFDLCVAVRGQ